ncbi:MAG: acetylglutamate kinase [Elusimicrobia bacterium]|nr:acetylglutamate kinase [Elusimicrobiota bacterium]
MKLVVKIGGAAIEDQGTLAKCAKAVADLSGQGHQVLVVHGGGAALTRLLVQLGKPAAFVDGLRVTDAETRDAALMVLAGIVNKKLVAAILAAGQPAVGLCGGDGAAFKARKKAHPKGDLGFVGEIASADTRWIQALWAAGAVPVMSTMALGPDHQYYNVNADSMAATAAAACQADALVFLTDVPGVKGADGAVMASLSVSRIAELVRSGVVKGGMLPKLQACQDALAGGARRVRILPSVKAEVLPRLPAGAVQDGTEVLAS